MSIRVDLLGVNYDGTYGLAFLVGAVIIFTFSAEKFDKPYPGNKYLSELLPSSLSPGSSYLKAFSIYACIILGIYGALSIILGTATSIWDVLFGEGAQKLVGAAQTEKSGTPVAPSQIPLLVALLMVGLFPKFKQFGDIEAPIRRFSHRLIGIPDGLERLTNVITTTALTRSSDTDDARAASIRAFLGHHLRELEPWAQSKLAQESRVRLFGAGRDGGGVELTDDQRAWWETWTQDNSPALRAASKWARVSILAEKILQDAAFGRSPDAEARMKYAGLRDDLKNDYDSLEAIVRSISNEQKRLADLIKSLQDWAKTKTDPGLPDVAARACKSLNELMQTRLDSLARLDAEIDAVLDREHLYIAAAIILKRGEDGQAASVSEWGLEPGGLPSPTPVDFIVLALLSMVGVLFVFNSAMYYALRAYSLSTSNPISTALRLVVSALLMHGGAALLTHFWRNIRPLRRRARGLPDAKRPVLQLVGLSAVVYVATLFALCAWTFALFALSPNRTGPVEILRLLPDGQLAAAYAVLSFAPVATAVFTTLNFDRIERGPIAPIGIAIRALSQGATTAGLVFVASQVQAPEDMYFALTSAANGFIIGVSLGASVLIVSSQSRGANQPLSAPLALLSRR